MGACKQIKTFKIGSRIFFESMPDYNPHDEDELSIMDPWPFGQQSTFRLRATDKNKSKKDIFICKSMTKEEFIQDYLDCDTPMRGNRFLNPEFDEYLDMNMEDFKRLEPKFKEMDEKHHYLLMIYYFYIENNGFFLTDEQKELAYKDYLEKRINP